MYEMIKTIGIDLISEKRKVISNSVYENLLRELRDKDFQGTIAFTNLDFRHFKVLEFREYFTKAQAALPMANIIGIFSSDVGIGKKKITLSALDGFVFKNNSDKLQEELENWGAEIEEKENCSVALLDDVQIIFNLSPFYFKEATTKEELSQSLSDLITINFQGLVFAGGVFSIQNYIGSLEENSFHEILLNKFYIEKIYQALYTNELYSFSKNIDDFSNILKKKESFTPNKDVLNNFLLKLKELKWKIC